MWARAAYPNGDAIDDVSATRSSGASMRRAGTGDGRGCPRGVESTRYAKPAHAASADWIVLRKTGKRK